MPPLLSATSVSIRRPVPLLLVVRLRDCQLLLAPKNNKATISQMLDIISCHNRYQKSRLISKIASTSMITQNKTVAEKLRCKHFCLKRVPPYWAKTNGPNHGWPSTQPGTCTQPRPIVHTAVPPLFTQPCPGRTMSRAVCIYVAGLCASCPAV